MSKLSDLIQLCKDYNINTDDVGLHGEHDVIYVHFNNTDLIKLPHRMDDDNIIPGFEDYESEEAEQAAETLMDNFADNYSLYIIEDGQWGFFT